MDIEEVEKMRFKPKIECNLLQVILAAFYYCSLYLSVFV